MTLTRMEIEEEDNQDEVNFLDEPEGSGSENGQDRSEEPYRVEDFIDPRSQESLQLFSGTELLHA